MSAALVPPDEVLVADARSGLTLSEMVGRKLVRLLGGGSVADSHVRTGGPLARGRASSRAS